MTVYGDTDDIERAVYRATFGAPVECMYAVVTPRTIEAVRGAFTAVYDNSLEVTLDDAEDDALQDLFAGLGLEEWA